MSGENGRGRGAACCAFVDVNVASMSSVDRTTLLSVLCFFFSSRMYLVGCSAVRERQLETLSAAAVVVGISFPFGWYVLAGFPWRFSYCGAPGDGQPKRARELCAAVGWTDVGCVSS